jgi:hypothetical protein
MAKKQKHRHKWAYAGVPRHSTLERSVCACGSTKDESWGVKVIQRPLQADGRRPLRMYATR